jgi:hypothetical protein
MPMLGDHVLGTLYTTLFQANDKIADKIQRIQFIDRQIALTPQFPTSERRTTDLLSDRVLAYRVEHRHSGGAKRKKHKELNLHMKMVSR